MTGTGTPKVLLIGAGRFGRQHLKELRTLEDEGKLSLAGIVVKSQESADAIAAKYPVPVHTGLTEDLLESVDAAVIATPTSTHEEIATLCLEHCDVLLEKPVAVSADGARKLNEQADQGGRVLMPGHVFRFHPVVQTLHKITSNREDAPVWVDIDFVNQSQIWTKELDPRLEFVHVFDISEFLLGQTPDILVPGQRGPDLVHASTAYPSGTKAQIRMGWAAWGPRRRITIRYPDLTIEADLLRNLIVTSSDKHEVDKTFFPGPSGALRSQLLAFLERIRTRSAQDLGATQEIGLHTVEMAERSKPRVFRNRPRCAVIGGGVFGATIAEEVSQHCDVDLFERHDHLLSEVSFANQWRHHSGFHYPRSYDTIQEIRSCKSEFETRFEPVIQRNIPAFYATSISGVEIPAERYLAACSGNYLSFTIDRPPAEILNPDQVSICLRTDEAVYDIPAMRELVRARLDGLDHVNLHMRTEVSGGRLLSGGMKELTATGPEGVKTSTYDYVINATYSRINLYAQWFGFPIEPLRFDLYELLVLDLPADQICVTVMDAPFCSLVGMGPQNRFMLSHIHDSVLKSQVTKDGMPPEWADVRSNRANMLAQAARYMPILGKADVIESRFATRAVNAFARDFDARPTVVRDHGFGCWSVLGGKILTCLSNAREIADAIGTEVGQISREEPVSPKATGSERRVATKAVAAR